VNQPLEVAKPRIVAFTGSTRRPSKSRQLAEAIAKRVAEHLPVTLEFYDVVDAGPGLGAAFTRGELTPEALKVVEAVEGADAIIAISPVYKGSYTGLFKHLIDFLDQDALLGRPVVIGATGGGHRHALIVEHQLRPLFGFFSAHTIPTVVYASEGEFIEGKIVDEVLLSRIDLAASQLAAALSDLRRVPSTTSADPEERIEDRTRTAARA
jgi:FMN reductase